MSNVSKLHGLASQNFALKVDEPTDAACIYEPRAYEVEEEIYRMTLNYCLDFRGS
jgi:hypothetical protein